MSETGDLITRMVKAFAELWNSLNDESGKRYADNPDVAVIQFGKVPNA